MEFIELLGLSSVFIVLEQLKRHRISHRIKSIAGYIQIHVSFLFEKDNHPHSNTAIYGNSLEEISASEVF